MNREHGYIIKGHEISMGLLIFVLGAFLCASVMFNISLMNKNQHESNRIAYNLGQAMGAACTSSSVVCAHDCVALFKSDNVSINCMTGVYDKVEEEQVDNYVLDYITKLMKEDQ